MFYTDCTFPFWFELLLPLLSTLTIYTARFNMAQAGQLAKSWESIHWGSMVLCTHLSPVLAPLGEDVSSQREATMHYLADPGNHRTTLVSGIWTPLLCSHPPCSVYYL